MQAVLPPPAAGQRWYTVNDLLDAYERSLGEPRGRERVKVVSREDMIAASRRAGAGEA